MPQLIKRFRDGSCLEYDQGSFDEWCVYYTRPNGKRTAPKDVAYFTALQRLAVHFTAEKMYQDFVVIYDQATQQIEPATLEQIERLAGYYGAEALRVEILLTMVYAGMIAEENKAHKKLGKRLKRLGLHQVWLEQLPPAQAAQFSRGRAWRELALECEKRGF